MEFHIPIVEKIKASKNFIELLNEHHLLGIFFQFFNDSTLPTECHNQYKKQWIHNQVIHQELEAIGELLSRRGITATILKGAHLLLDLYPDLGSRFLSDIDLLISNNDIDVLEKTLTELGYSFKNQKKFHGNYFKRDYSKLIGNIEINIELHTKLFFHLEDENWTKETTPYLNLNKLSPEDLFVHLCGHLAFQHTFSSLYWLFDIYFYYQKDASQINWKGVRQKSIEHNLYRSTQMCLWIIRKYFGVALPKKIIELFDLDKKQWWQKHLTIDFLISPHAKKSTYFLIKHATKDQLTSALYYDLTWFFHYKIQKNS